MAGPDQIKNLIALLLRPLPLLAWTETSRRRCCAEETSAIDIAKATQGCDERYSSIVRRMLEKPRPWA